MTKPITYYIDNEQSRQFCQQYGGGYLKDLSDKDLIGIQAQLANHAANLSGSSSPIVDLSAIDERTAHGLISGISEFIRYGRPQQFEDNVTQSNWRQI